MAAKKNTSPPAPAPAKRGGGPKAIARTVARIARRGFASQGFAEGEVITRWREIVGAALAERSVPVRMGFRKGSVGGATLHVRVDGAAALELQHLEPRVIERINGFFGYRAVERLRLVQGPLGRARRESALERKQISAAEAARLERTLANVGDDKLRQALGRLGASTLGHDPAAETGKE